MAQKRSFLCAEQVKSSCSRFCILLEFRLCQQPIFNIRDTSYMRVCVLNSSEVFMGLALRLVAGKEAFSKK